MDVHDLINKDLWNTEDGYQVVLADPPWDYGNWGAWTGDPRLKGVKHLRENKMNSIAHYPSMTMDELKAMPVRDLCCDECVLFMWATGPKMAEAVELGRAWGFEYRTVAYVWNKTRVTPGGYTLPQCEFVLVFRPKRGVLPYRAKKNSRQYFEEPRTVHSKKPERVQDELDEIYPDARKLELFARRSRPGWDVWGNETDKFD